MPTTTFKAHYDGEHVVLDEPFDLPPDTRLLVTVLSTHEERADWTAFSASNLGRAYGSDEPEYTAADTKPE